MRHAVQAVAKDLKFPAARCSDLVAAVGEGAMNTIVHAGGGSATICRDPNGTEIQVWIRDNGRGISATHLHRATLECGFTTANSLGCGFFIILNTVDSLSLLTGAAGTTIVLSQRREKLTNSPPIEFFSWISSDD
ncbi:MAG: ATP-binding protein [Akkermansiaceae bacterium]|nr:ATP-binding protein [Armatimonadota bacterium]